MDGWWVCLLREGVVYGCFVTCVSEKEMVAEKQKLYDALGYSENVVAAIYPKEVRAHE